MNRLGLKLAVWWLDRKTKGTIMSGWKTWVGGLTLALPGLAEILIGTAMILKEVIDGTYNIDPGMAHIKTGSVGVGAGLGVIGIGHKLEKTSSVPTK